MAAFRRHPRAWLGAALAAAIILVGGVAFGVGAAVGAPRVIARAPVTTTSTPTPTATVRAVPSDIPTPVAFPTCSVAKLKNDPALGAVAASVVDADTGQSIYSVNGSIAAAPASVMKLITAGAALRALGPNYQIETQVTANPADPSGVILVGGGDPVLTAGGGTYFPGAASVVDLAQQTAQYWTANFPGVALAHITPDATLFAGSTWLDTWDRAAEHDANDGSTPDIVALEVDGDRATPTALSSKRLHDGPGAIQAAGQAFATALAAALGQAPTSIAVDPPATAHVDGAAVLGSVLSPPVATLVHEALLYSDNTVMEYLARLVAIKEGVGNTFADEDTAMKQAMQAYGLDPTALSIFDGSGLSSADAVPPAFLTRYLVKINSGDEDLKTIYDALPIAGRTGTLASRFTGQAAVARGQVNAKTGTLSNAATIAGIIHAKDGSVLSFAIFAEKTDPNAARAALDNLAAGFYSCGLNIAKY